MTTFYMDCRNGVQTYGGVFYGDEYAPPPYNVPNSITANAPLPPLRELRPYQTSDRQRCEPREPQQTYGQQQPYYRDDPHNVVANYQRPPCLPMHRREHTATGDVPFVNPRHDHPSFLRPPHRELPGKAPAQTAKSWKPEPWCKETEDAKLCSSLVEGIVTVPPPPPVEQSALPLADLAADMIWEACLIALSSSVFHVIEGDIVASRKTVVRRPDFGAIGDGRHRHPVSHRSSDSINSLDSSPDSSGPGTPIGVEGVFATAARQQYLLGLDLGTHNGGDFKLNSAQAYHFDTLAQRPMPGPHHTSAATSVRTPPLSVETSDEFRDFVKTILEGSLVMPEDLVMAMHFVTRLQPSSFVLPNKAGNQDSVEAIRSVPSKIFLGTLMLANKTLQDHPYRNEIWALLSGIPVKEVNEIETHVFRALDYDLALHCEVWRTWVGVVRARTQTERHIYTDSLSGPLLRLHRLACTSTSSQSATERSSSMGRGRRRRSIEQHRSVALMGLKDCAPVGEPLLPSHFRPSSTLSSDPYFGRD